MVWPAVWVSLIPLFLAIRGRRAKQGAGLGCWFGLGVALPGLFWMVAGVGFFTGSGSMAYGLLAYAGSGLLLVVAFGLLVAGLTQIDRAGCPRWLRMLNMAAVWTIWETLFSWLLVGMPWFSFHIGSGLLKNGLAIQSAAIGGIALLSFVPVAVNALAASFVTEKKWNALLIPAGIVGAYFGLCAALLAGWNAKTPTGKPVSVAILSENIPPDQKWDEQNGARIVSQLLGLAREAAALHPDIALWSETIVPWTYRPDDDFVQALLKTAQGSGTTHILGISTAHDAQTVYNSAYAILPDGRVVGRYDKRVLLSFIEASVAGWAIPFITIEDFLVAPGTNGQPLPTPHGPAGIMICNEAAVPAAATGMAAAGAAFILNLSNDGWFSQTYLADLHFYSARLRAVEVRKDVVVNSNTGTSGMIAASGEVRMARRSEDPFVAMTAVQPNQYRSLLTRWPWITEACCGAILLLFAGQLFVDRKQ